jgi:hypothetical protein
MTNLALLSNSQLEHLWNEANLSCDGDASEALALELMKRPDAAPKCYDLMWEMQDLGWGGEVSQDEMDNR